MFTNYKEFKNIALGKRVDYDGYYGAQCWDLFAWYNDLQGYPQINCTSTGYVKDISNNDQTNGILNNYHDIKKATDLKEGDWIVFGEGNPQTPYSHIAMYVGNEEFMGQNQNGLGYVTIIELPLVDIIGVYRDKSFKEESYPIEKSGSVVAQFDQIRVRTEPTLSSGDTGLVYNTGMLLNYVDIVINDGWYWLKYNRSNGGIGYCAYCPVTNTSNPYWK